MSPGLDLLVDKQTLACSRFVSKCFKTNKNNVSQHWVIF